MSYNPSTRQAGKVVMGSEKSRPLVLNAGFVAGRPPTSFGRAYKRAGDEARDEAGDGARDVAGDEGRDELLVTS
jgi:hypothetical protein